MPSINVLCSTLFRVCSWPLHGRMKMLVSSVIMPATLSLICVALLGRRNSFPMLREIRVQQWEEGKAHLKHVVFSCVVVTLCFCMGLQNKNSLGSNDSDCSFKTFIFIFCFIWPHLWRETIWCYSSCPLVIMLQYGFLTLSDCSAGHPLFKYRMC